MLHIYKKVSLRLITSLTIAISLISLTIIGLNGIITPGQTLAFTLNPITTYPFSNTHTALSTTHVSITYNEAVSISTVNTQTFAVYAMQTGLVAQTYYVTDSLVSLKPTAPFKAGELVQASATTNILGISGGTANFANSPTVWQFRISPLGGSAAFSLSSQLVLDTNGQDVAIGDITQDGNLDLLIAHPDSFQLLENNAQNLGQFSPKQISPMPNGVTASSLSVGDLDQDNDLDVIIGTNYGNANQLWFNDGNGFLILDETQSIGTNTTNDIALGDLNGDGTLDAFIANNGQPTEVWFNTGHGIFTPSLQSMAVANANAVALGDVDGDYDLDAYLANDGNNTLWLNDGTGYFTQTTILNNANSQDIALGDLDNDGDLDAIVVNNPGANYLWLNNGQGIFTQAQAITSSINNSTGVDIGDFDADGDLDLFIINNGTNKIWLNNGGSQTGTPGTFAPTPQDVGSADSQTIALGDLDNDGELDALIGNFNSQNNLWFNNLPTVDLSLQKTVTPAIAWHRQTVTYTLKFTNNNFISSQNVLVTDTFPANILPLQISSNLNTTLNTNGSNYQWTINKLLPHQTGLITITARVSGSVPIGSIVTNQAIIAATTQDVITMNNTAQATFTLIAPPPVYLPFVLKNWPPIPGDVSLTLARHNNDSYDLVWTKDSNLFADTYLLQQAEGISFTAPINIYQGANRTYTITNQAAGTYYYRVRGHNNAGFDGPWSNIISIDVIGSPSTVTLRLEDWQNVNYTLAWDEDPEATNYKLVEALGPAFSNAPLIYNGPNLNYNIINKKPLDDFKIPVGMYFYRVIASNEYFSGGWSNIVSTIVLGGEGGSGIFEELIQPNFITPTINMGIALGDIDDDGDFDAVIGRYNKPSEVWLNNNTGLFTKASDFGPDSILNLALGDLDADDDLDIFMVRGGATDEAENRNEIWFNDGNGQFSHHQTMDTQRDSYDVALGDLDADGDLDAFVANHNQANLVWFNDSNGTFIASNQNLGNSLSNDVALGDLDGDGDLDAFVANGAIQNGSSVFASERQANIVWLNDGTGSFSYQQANSLLRYSYAVDIGDLDGDGDLDAFVGNFEDQNKVWLNDGQANFTAGPDMPDVKDTYDVAIGDLDGDGDLDVFLVNLGNGLIDKDNQVWHNDGTGLFTKVQTMGDSPTRGIALGDLNDDNNLDAFIINLNEINRVWLNKN